MGHTMKLPDRRFKNKQKEVLFLHNEIAKLIAMGYRGD